MERCQYEIQKHNSFQRSFARFNFACFTRESGVKNHGNFIGNLSQHFVGGIVKEHFSTEKSANLVSVKASNLHLEIESVCIVHSQVLKQIGISKWFAAYAEKSIQNSNYRQPTSGKSSQAGLRRSLSGNV